MYWYDIQMVVKTGVVGAWCVRRRLLVVPAIYCSPPPQTANVLLLPNHGPPTADAKPITLTFPSIMIWQRLRLANEQLIWMFIPLDYYRAIGTTLFPSPFCHGGLFCATHQSVFPQLVGCVCTSVTARLGCHHHAARLLQTVTGNHYPQQPHYTRFRPAVQLLPQYAVNHAPIAPSARAVVGAHPRYARSP